MPDLPTPQDATEAALFAECWDAVLSYADLCTVGPESAGHLASEAFAAGLREARDAGTGPGAARRPTRLPRVPLLLVAVRTTAAAWEEAGRGDGLDPDLRLWLNSEHAARYSGPPLGRPVALRGLRDMQEPDAALLWLTEVEALPPHVVARKLGLDPATVSDELAQVRALFRDRCRRNHLDTPMDARCRSYARLLDAVHRSPAADMPGDLSRHLATCVPCAEAAACLRPHGGGLPAALAGGVLGWGGLAYLERRRRAAEARLAAHPDADTDTGPVRPGAQKARMVRGALLVTAVLVSGLALAVSMTQGGSSAGARAADGDLTERRPAVDPTVSLPVTAATRPAREAPRPSAGASRSTDPAPRDPDPEPQGTTSPTARPDTPRPPASATPSCTAVYDLVNEWTDGFQAIVTVTTDRPLDGWSVAWSFRDGQRVGQMWDADYVQNGPSVTASAADYNQSVAAGGKITFGFLGSWRGANSPARDLTLDGRPCTLKTG